MLFFAVEKREIVMCEGACRNVNRINLMIKITEVCSVAGYMSLIGVGGDCVMEW